MQTPNPYQFPPPQAPPQTAPQAPVKKRRSRAAIAGVGALTAVALAAAAAGAVVLFRRDGERPPAAPADPSKPIVAGWKTVVNPQHGTAFDVPPDWEVLAPTVFSGHVDDVDPDKVLIGHTAPALYKSRWCSIDGDGDGQVTDVRLANTGTKGAVGAKDAAEVAEKTAPTWVYAAYTQPDKSVVKWDKPKEYTTRTGVKGSYVTARSEGAAQPNRCAGDGRAVVFGFKNSRGDLVAWNFYGRTGVPGAVGDALIMRIMSTVRLAGEPKDPAPGP
ncbi:hypothetical protein [Streptomyces erythrochromogenes]|uniref:hypothetical protein n=1 Tax=Streptomyces erythrochromogenes TaxID=285574 RepID=UPI00068AD071|nr:hypothetical protein [Streptomyces erythrochromogenes]